MRLNYTWLLALPLVSASMQQKPLKVGQEWQFQGRTVDPQPTLVIDRIEQVPGLGEVVHVSVRGVQIRNPRAPKGYTDRVGHMPFVRSALEKSITELLHDSVDHPDYEEGLAALKRLQPGVTWRDVLPGLPSHWQAGRPETWTTSYRPFGPFDYQELPTGPAVHVSWNQDAPERLAAIVATARQAGWPIFSAGLVAKPSDTWRTYDAIIVLERGTTEERLYEFAAWIDDQSGFTLATIPRLGTEQYVMPGEGGHLTSA